MLVVSYSSPQQSPSKVELATGETLGTGQLDLRVGDEALMWEAPPLIRSNAN